MLVAAELRRVPLRILYLDWTATPCITFVQYERAISFFAVSVWFAKILQCDFEVQSHHKGSIAMKPLLEPVELRRQGFEALVAALGWVNAVRFLQQYEISRLDYTQERQQFLPDWDAETLVRKARKIRRSPRAS
jgi:hypothetical protein